MGISSFLAWGQGLGAAAGLGATHFLTFPAQTTQKGPFQVLSYDPGGEGAPLEAWD